MEDTRITALSRIGVIRLISDRLESRIKRNICPASMMILSSKAVASLIRSITTILLLLLSLTIVLVLLSLL